MSLAPGQVHATSNHSYYRSDAGQGAQSSPPPSTVEQPHHLSALKRGEQLVIGTGIGVAAGTAVACLTVPLVTLAMSGDALYHIATGKVPIRQGLSTLRSEFMDVSAAKGMTWRVAAVVGIGGAAAGVSGAHDFDSSLHAGAGAGAVSGAVAGLVRAKGGVATHVVDAILYGLGGALAGGFGGLTYTAFHNGDR